MLSPGDVLLLYTDGITEAASDTGEMFGEERLAELLRTSGRLSPQALIDLIFLQVRLFTGTQSFDDDVSLVVLQISSRE